MRCDGDNLPFGHCAEERLNMIDNDLLLHEGEEDAKFCGRCKEDFPVADEGQALRMGLLFPIRRVPKKVRQRINPGFPYLCGNCWFDILDD